MLKTYRIAVLPLAAAWVFAASPSPAQDRPAAPETSSVPNAQAVVIQGKKIRRDRKSVRIDARSGSSCAFMRGFSPYDEDVMQDYLEHFGGNRDTAINDPGGDETDPLRPGARVRDVAPFGSASQDNNGQGSSPGDRVTSTTPGGCTQADVAAASGRNSILRHDKTLTQAFVVFDSGDYPKALELFEKSYQKIGYDEAAFMLAKMYLAGLGAPADVEKGIFWLKKVAEARFDPKDEEIFDPAAPFAMSTRANATMTLASIYLTGAGVPRDPKEARKWFEKAYSIGFIPAAHILGQIYQNGLEVPVNVDKAIKYYERAGEFGFTPSQYELGLIYYAGEGVPEDRKLAARWLMAAASGGHPDALYEVGRMYDLGDTLPQDSAKALVYYKEAALKDQPAAQNALATYFYSGELLDKDLNMARKWFEVAANNGEPDAMFNLAVMLMNGEGGSEDLVLAFVWLKLAEMSGLEKATSLAAKVAARLSPEQRDRADAILNPTPA
ncbi:sel1 repeat family protein [Asticcacaulis biprosthecium C19]|uniref:Sel1 repeat family protein n=1 Tax=Asticcacaulis biprosthecium C19 TaxID=715226 RepID=F4QQY4_9CAUL|nr:SEL1-like repeat protein [Asticcacaulis biprosthecium]EGF90621.1 sel1 repeat family protein [Asticcacaulis biprosthecium C19]